MTSKIIAVAGAGPGISLAVAERFGKGGFKVALMARTKSKLDGLVAGLMEKGIETVAFPVDLGSPSAVKGAFADIKQKLGPVTVLHWNAYPAAYGKLMELPEETLNTLSAVGITGLVTTVQAALPQMEGQEAAAVLVTNGGLYRFDEGTNGWAASSGSGGLAYVNSAKHKITGILNIELGEKGIFVGELSMNGIVKGSAWDKGNTPTIEPATIADNFWEIYVARSPLYSDLS